MPKPLRSSKDRKAKSRLETKKQAITPESNVIELAPLSKADRDEKRRRREEELQAQAPKTSKKKQKRLEAYIAKKLRREQNLELLKKLAQAKVDTSLLRSSKTLGAIRETRREFKSRVLRERNAGVSTETYIERLQEDSDESGSSSGDDTSSDERDPARAPPLKQAPPVQHNPGAVLNSGISLGSGLKRPLELDESGKPLIPKRRKKSAAVDLFTKSSPGGLNAQPSKDASRHSEELTAATGVEADDVADGSDKEEEDNDVVEFASSSDASDAESSAASEDGRETPPKNASNRISAFKAWAEQQRNEALGFQPSTVIEQARISQALIPKGAINPRPNASPKLTSSHPPPNVASRKAFAVYVDRDEETQAHRLQLPVVMEEQKIMEAIHNNVAVILCGATGSGKTTQVPQFLYEAGYGNPESENPGIIGITQPRRVAAVSMAKRVAAELGNHSDRVAYKIRFEGTVGERTRIKFMTDGILLREASEDITLKKYSAIVIDEAHEMSKDTSILIGMLSRIIRLRETLGAEDSSIRPLKLIIMSATQTVADLASNKNLFPHPPPIVHVEGRQYPVTIHWARRTTYDYLDEAFRKVARGHRNLPPGSMLVFLTSRKDILTLSSGLKHTFSGSSPDAGNSGVTVQLSAKEVPLETEDFELGHPLHAPAGLEEESEDETEQDDDEDDADFNAPHDETPGPVHVLPLYSLLPTEEQLRVFEPPPEGARLIVLATNIAETSLTIPGIRYVFDCGRAKERRYNAETGVQSFEIGWISKASANQRTGRAGRTGPGHCYRLYSSAVYERDFPEFTEPEMQRTPLEGVVLQLVGLGVPNILEKFPFPTPVDPLRLTKAKNLLSYLGAISASDELTEMGRKMAAFPLLPRFSKILLSGHAHGCLPYTIALVAALSVPDIFLPEDQSSALPSAASEAAAGRASGGDLAHAPEDAQEGTRSTAYKHAHYRLSQLGGDSDALKLLAAILGDAAAPDPRAFCAEFCLRHKAVREAQLLRQQLTQLLRADPAYASMLPPPSLSSSSSSLSPPLPAPSKKQVKYLKLVVASGFVDQVAIRADLAPVPPPPPPRKPKSAAAVPYLPLMCDDGLGRYSNGDGGGDGGGGGNDEKAVYIHPASVLAHRCTARSAPPYIVYASMQRSANAAAKVRLHPLTPVSALQLAALTRGTPLQSVGKPLKEVTVDDGADGLRRVCWVIPTLRGSAGTQGWPLPARKIVQRRVNGVWVEEGA